MIRPGFGGLPLHPNGPPLFLSYGVILPNSLTRVLPFALVSSTHLPVSVCGTVTKRLARGFSRQCGLSHLRALGPPPSPLRLKNRISLALSSPYRFGT